MSVELTAEEIRDDVRLALVEEGFKPTEARTAVSLCQNATSFSDLYREALNRLRPKPGIVPVAKVVPTPAVNTTCRHCGKPTRKGNEICVSCRHDLQHRGEGQLSDDVRFCANAKCKKRLRSDCKSELCSACRMGTDERAAPAEAPVVESKRSEESAMAKTICLCGCGGEIQAAAAARGWKYVRGHKPNPGEQPPKKNGGAAKKKHPAQHAPKPPNWPDEAATDPVAVGVGKFELTEPQMDKILLAMPIGRKVEAVSAALQEYLSR